MHAGAPRTSRAHDEALRTGPGVRRPRQRRARGRRLERRDHLLGPPDRVGSVAQAHRERDARPALPPRTRRSSRSGPQVVGDRPLLPPPLAGQRPRRQQRERRALQRPSGPRRRRAPGSRPATTAAGAAGAPTQTSCRSTSRHPRGQGAGDRRRAPRRSSAARRGRRRRPRARPAIPSGQRRRRRHADPPAALHGERQAAVGEDRGPAPSAALGTDGRPRSRPAARRRGASAGAAGRAAARLRSRAAGRRRRGRAVDRAARRRRAGSSRLLVCRKDGGSRRTARARPPAPRPAPTGLPVPSRRVLVLLAGIGVARRPLLARPRRPGPVRRRDPHRLPARPRWSSASPASRIARPPGPPGAPDPPRLRRRRRSSSSSSRCSSSGR